jgi:hypothetical protein
MIFLCTQAACANEGSDQAPIEEVLPALGAQEDAFKQDGDDAALRTIYKASDMRLHECAKLQADGSVVGENCPSAFIVFGPYVAAPGNADVRLTFDIESGGDVVVASDVVSAMAKTFHGAMDEQAVSATAPRRLTYRIHFFQPTYALETRLWVRGEGASNFKISNLALEVK